MNAKELAESYREQAKRHQQDGMTLWADTFDTVALEIDQLIPRYRPPQPSDVGMWCFLEQDNAPDEPMLVNCSAGTWKAWDAEEKKYIPITKGVWPCERPEGGA